MSSMELESYPVKKLKKQILEIVGEYLDLNVYNVFFFGSRVKGDNFPRSDIDIGIKGPNKIPAVIKLKIREEIYKLPTLYKFDIVYFNNVSEKFKREALKNVEYIR